MRKICILFTFLSILLFGCSGDLTTQSVTTSNSLHNYDTEMLTAALKEHKDFPKLTTKEPTVAAEVAYNGHTYPVVYSWMTEINSHGSTTKTDSKNANTLVWTEDSSADYYITLMKIWETKDGNIKSYWKYKYSPQTNEIKLIESEDNDSVVSSTEVKQDKNITTAEQNVEEKITKEFVKENAKVGFSYDEVRKVFGQEQHSEVMENIMTFVYDSTTYKPFDYTKGYEAVAFEALRQEQLDYQLYINFLQEKAVYYQYYFKGDDRKVWGYTISLEGERLKKTSN